MAFRLGPKVPLESQPVIQVGSVAVAEKDRNKSMDNVEKWDTDADFSLNDGAREITDEDRITLGLYDGWPYKLSDICLLTLASENGQVVILLNQTSRTPSWFPTTLHDRNLHLRRSMYRSCFGLPVTPTILIRPENLKQVPGVPGIRVYPVDVFFRATSNPQVFNQVDASQNSDNSRTEMEAQVSPRRPSIE
ncbi:hypothetical protein MAJ_11206, partial [Metarhizium majus ARSEF 297]